MKDVANSLCEGLLEYLGRNVDAATTKDAVQRAEHHLAGSRFWKEAERTEVEGFHDPVAILVARKNHDRHASFSTSGILRNNPAQALRSPWLARTRRTRSLQRQCRRGASKITPA